MTREAICALGYENMKLFVKPHVYLWLASEGWERVFEVEAVPIPNDPEGNIGLRCIGWAQGTLLPETTWN